MMSASELPKQLSKSAKLAWAALVINVLTVLGGTLVRATGSGAGCGESWPSCHGALVPSLASFHTRVEFAHRALSGLALLSVLILFVSVYRNFKAKTAARRVVNFTALAIVVESLLGAWLVLARLVEDDASVMRAISVPIHLVNTLFLLGALTLTAWVLTYQKPLRWPSIERRKLLAAAFGLLLLAATGAITALADTLFPLNPAGLAGNIDAPEHFLAKLRVIHPIVALLVAAFLVYLAADMYERNRGYAQALLGLVGIQLALGVLNVLLVTPLVIQIGHLLVADLMWITLVLSACEIGADAKNKT